MPGPLPSNTTPSAPLVTVDPISVPAQPPDKPGTAATPGQQIGAGVAAAATNGTLIGTVGPEITPITFGIITLIERFKHEPKFNERYAFYYSVVLSLFVVVIGYWMVKGDPFHAVVNFFALIGNNHITYTGMKATGTGIFKPVEPQNQYGGH
jgi:hypothetical protein